MKPQSTTNFLAPILLTVSSLLLGGCSLLGDGPKTRPAGVAGYMYTADPKELSKIVDEFLAKASVPQIKEPLVAIIAPHACLMCSGPVAAYSYALLKGKKFERVVVIAPSHLEAFPFSSVYDGDAYSTPLGTVPVDKAFGAQLAALSPRIKVSNHGHGEVEGHWEHALEDELPFLQRVLGEFKLVPIVMGDQGYDACRALGISLAKLIAGSTQGSPVNSGTLIVVSSDLSHYHPYGEAVSIDRQTLHAIEEWDYLSLWRNFATRTWEACGGGPIVAAMIAAERLGATHAQILKYANSGDTMGDKSSVVGYGAVAITQAKTEATKKSAEFSLTDREKSELLKIARLSVQARVRDRTIYLVGSTGFPSLEEARGAFVTLKENGDLRGCIGYIQPVKPLAETVRDVAVYAAVEDPRFQPVGASELPLLQYEISVLSPLQRVTDIKQIKVGKHGLVIREGDAEGVLLPQVPTEQGWDRNTFLEQVCLKAGLPPHAWRNDDTDLFMFTAIVFGGQIRPEPATQDTANAPAPPSNSRDLPGPPAKNPTPP